MVDILERGRAQVVLRPGNVLGDLGAKVGEEYYYELVQKSSLKHAPKKHVRVYLAQKGSGARYFCFFDVAYFNQCFKRKERF